MLVKITLLISSFLLLPSVVCVPLTFELAISSPNIITPLPCPSVLVAEDKRKGALNFLHNDFSIANFMPLSLLVIPKTLPSQISCFFASYLSNTLLFLYMNLYVLISLYSYLISLKPQNSIFHLYYT